MIKKLKSRFCCCMCNCAQWYWYWVEYRQVFKVHRSKPEPKLSDLPLPEILSSDIAELNINVRTYNVLARADVHTVGRLIQMTPDEILSLPHSGERVLEKVVESLQECKLKLREEIDNN